MNLVLLEGNLVRDPEKVQGGSNGSVMGKFSLAVDRYTKKDNAESVEEVMYIGV
ncbi:MAG: single-stranded DNA-binding protein [Peptostreptococcaceae bacterium]|nr:single-stranded DNA-binding protein [Peptostreptococcaceae bacterium]